MLIKYISLKHAKLPIIEVRYFWCWEIKSLLFVLFLLCIQVDNINEALKTLEANNVRALDPTPKIGAHGKPVVFLHPKDCGGVLTELEEA